MTFEKKIDEIISIKNSRVCLGLDTDIDKLPNGIENSLDGILQFNKEIISSTQDLVSAYKINIAFYECYGSKGWDILDQTLKSIPKDIITIADAKRADIGNTSNYYAKTFFDTYGFDSVTVAPYMGYDSLKPFLSYEDKGTICLVLTSNSGSIDFQEEKLENGQFVFEKVAEKLNEWNTNQNIMAVVGATNSENIKKIRKLMPNTFFLVPGVGSQGGSVKDVIKYAGDKVLINSSRSLIYASSNSDFKEKCREKTIELKNEINSFIS